MILINDKLIKLAINKLIDKIDKAEIKMMVINIRYRYLV